LLTDKKEAWLGEMYFDAAESVLNHMEQTTSPTGLKYIGEFQGGQVVKKVDHLACFAAGMYALGAHHTSDKTMAARHMEFAKGFAQFCYNMYSRMPTKLAADVVTVNDNHDFEAAGSRYFILRPGPFDEVTIPCPALTLSDEL
jgi:mannosyl-oligosaccharide alpha-1,2-mannosidase